MAFPMTCVIGHITDRNSKCERGKKNQRKNKDSNYKKKKKKLTVSKIVKEKSRHTKVLMAIATSRKRVDKRKRKPFRFNFFRSGRKGRTRFLFFNFLARLLVSKT